MFVNTQHRRTARTLTLAAAQLEEILEPTLDGGAADAFSLAQTAAADAVPVLERHATPEWFGGSFPRQNSGKSLPKTAIAIPATPLARFQFQHHMPYAPAFVAQPPQPTVAETQAVPAALRTLHQALVASLESDPSRSFFDACNLVPRQA